MGLAAISASGSLTCSCQMAAGAGTVEGDVEEQGSQAPLSLPELSGLHAISLCGGWFGLFHTATLRTITLLTWQPRALEQVC